MGQALQRSRRNPVNKNSVQSKLREKLARLQRLFDAGYELKVVWKPSPEKKVDGEVIDDKILLYVERPQLVEALYHEFFHYLVSKVSLKYKRIIDIQRKFINNLLESLAEEAYREEEDLVEKMVIMLDALDTIKDE